MTTNLLDRVQDHLTPEVIAGIADGAAETTETTRSAMQVIGPALLDAIIRFAKAPSGGARMLEILREGGYDRFDHRALVERISSPHARTQLKLEGSSLVDRILADRRLPVAEELGRRTELSGPTIGRFMSLAMPVVMGAVGRVVAEKGLDAPRLVSLLTEQESAVAHAFPTEVPPKVEARAPTGRSTRREHEERASRVPTWLFAAALALLALIFFPRLFPTAYDPFRESVDEESSSAVETWGDRERRAKEEERAAKEAAEAEEMAGPGAAEETEERAAKGKAEGVEATEQGEEQAARDAYEEEDLAKGKPEANRPHLDGHAEPGTLEDIERYLASDDESARSFALEELHFASGKAELSKEAAATIDRLAELVAKHPKAVVLVKGRSDDQGKASENRRLSTERARAVGERLIEKGVEARRVRVLSAGASEAAGGERESDRAVDLTIVKGDMEAGERTRRY